MRLIVLLCCHCSTIAFSSSAWIIGRGSLVPRRILSSTLNNNINNQEPHPPQTNPQSTIDSLLKGEDIQENENDSVPFFLQGDAVESEKDYSIRSDSSITPVLIQKSKALISDILSPCFDGHVQKGVPLDTIKGAALAGLGLSAFVGKSLTACGFISLGAMYMAITPGKAGDFIRTIGSMTWTTTENAIELYNEYNVSDSIQNMANRWLVPGVVSETIPSLENVEIHFVDESHESEKILETNPHLEETKLILATETVVPVEIISVNHIDSTPESMPTHEVGSLSQHVASSITEINPEREQVKSTKQDMESFEISITLKKKRKSTSIRRKEEDEEEEEAKMKSIISTRESKKKSKRSQDLESFTHSSSRAQDEIHAANAKLTVSELKEKLKNVGLKVSGVKAELIDRINAYEARSSS